MHKYIWPITGKFILHLRVAAASSILQYNDARVANFQGEYYIIMHIPWIWIWLQISSICVIYTYVLEWDMCGRVGGVFYVQSICTE